MTPEPAALDRPRGIALLLIGPARHDLYFGDLLHRLSHILRQLLDGFQRQIHLAQIHQRLRLVIDRRHSFFLRSRRLERRRKSFLNDRQIQGFDPGLEPSHRRIEMGFPLHIRSGLQLFTDLFNAPLGRQRIQRFFGQPLTQRFGHLIE